MRESRIKVFRLGPISSVATMVIRVVLSGVDLALAPDAVSTIPRGGSRARSSRHLRLIVFIELIHGQKLFSLLLETVQGILPL